MRAGWIAVALLATGCLYRNAPEPRFFRPESALLDGSAGAPSEVAPSTGTGVALRLRPVRGTPLLRERIVWRASSVEYGLYEQRRWSDLPARYVERALQNALRVTPGIRLTDETAAAVLHVEVVAFDEVMAPDRVAAVSLVVELSDAARLRLIDRTFHAEAQIENQAAAATAIAMGKALDEVVAAVALAAGERLQGR
jgi:ABC-type uncharacterized transport system auxiliary subunit